MSSCCNRKENDTITQFDLIVIGAGSGGFSAAITAAEQGKTVLLVGYGIIGGTCVNIGCVPSKNIIRAVEILHNAKQANRFSGIEAQAEITNWEALIAQKQSLVDELRQAKYSNILPEYPKVTYLPGKARLDQSGVIIDNQTYQADKIIIATGSSNKLPPILGLKDINYLDSTRLLEIKKLPKSLLVIGAGVIGCELAQAFSRAGVKVTLCCRSCLLPDEEPEISEALTDYFQQEGITVHQGIQYKKIEKVNKGYQLTFENSFASVIADEVLVSTGRKPNTDELGCKEVGIKLNSKGGIDVDEHLMTTNPDIYAVGDVTGRDMFVYMAAYGAKLAVNNALSSSCCEKQAYDASTMPVVTFTDPQVARVGLTEQQAKLAGFEVKTSMLLVTQVPRAIAARNTKGVIKLVADRQTDVLLGAHICATEAGDSIQTATLAIKHKMTATELGSTIFPYLTMVEGLKLAAQTFDKDISKLSCCAG